MSNTKKILTLSLSFIVILGIGLLIKDNRPSVQKESGKSQVVINELTLNIDIADTPHKQEQGLSGKLDLKDDEGMLFVFNTTETKGFWMKDMLFPIDIIWMDEDLIVVYVDKNLSPDTYPTIFYPPSPVKYILEVNSGFSDRNNVKIGDELIFRP